MKLLFLEWEGASLTDLTSFTLDQKDVATAHVETLVQCSQRESEAALIPELTKLYRCYPYVQALISIAVLTIFKPALVERRPLLC